MDEGPWEDHIFWFFSLGFRRFAQHWLIYPQVKSPLVWWYVLVIMPPGKWKGEGQEFVIFCDIASLRPAWSTWDSLKEQENSFYGACLAILVPELGSLSCLLLYRNNMDTSQRSTSMLFSHIAPDSLVVKGEWLSQVALAHILSWGYQDVS